MSEKLGLVFKKGLVLCYFLCVFFLLLGSIIYTIVSVVIVNSVLFKVMLSMILILLLWVGYHLIWISKEMWVSFLED